jgi:hypothetical protein
MRRKTKPYHGALLGCIANALFERLSAVSKEN